MKALLNNKGLLLSELSKRGGVFKNTKEFQIDVAIVLGISFSRVRDLVSEMKSDGLVSIYKKDDKKIHGKYNVNPAVMRFFQPMHKGM